MTEEAMSEAQLKLQTYHAAIAACNAGKDYSMQSMGSRTGPSTSEIRAEAERLWAWMVGGDKKAV